MPLPSLVLEEEFQPIINSIKNFETKKIKANEVIFRQGFKCEYFFWIIKGIVKISIISEEGNEKILGFHRNSLFGMDLWCKQNFAVVTATAHTDLELCYIPHDEMKKIINKNPKLGIALISYVSDVMRLMVFHMSSHLFLDAKTRIIDILYLYSHMARHCEFQKTIHMTGQELADLTGISRVHVTRIMKELKESKLIATKRNTITILDKDRLIELCRF